MVASINQQTDFKPLREPSARNQDVYQRVVIEGLTQREAAAEFGVSQGRVCQIVKRVGLWIQQTPGDDEEAPASSGCGCRNTCAGCGSIMPGGRRWRSGAGAFSHTKRRA